MTVRPETAARLTNRVYPAETPGLVPLLSLAVGVVIVAALWVGREVLIPLTLSVLLAFVLGPVVALFRRLFLPKGLAVLLAGVLALGVIVVLGGLIGTQIAQLTTDLPRYASTIERKVDSVRAFATSHLSSLTNGLGSIAQPKPAAEPAKPTAEPAQPKPIPVEIHNPNPTAFALAESLLMPVVPPLVTASVVFVVAIFILWQREDLRDRIIRLCGSDDLHRTTAALDDAARRLGRYYLSLLAVNTGFGVIIGGGLLLIGVPSPILWGVLAGLLRFVPYIGSFAGAVAPLLLSAAVDPGWTMVLETAGLFLLVEPVLGQVFEPMIYGHSTGLSPVSVVIAAIFWGWIWGAIGLLLSMPLTLCLVVLGKHIKRLEFLYVMLGDKPALTPEESLYQRMLVGDSDEALQQAETLLASSSLDRYYEEVAIPALRRAANDSLRGVLTDEQLRRVMDAICGVIVDLGESQGAKQSDGEAATAAPEPQEGVILCVAGRGPLDEAVCAMLADLMSRRGVKARVVPTASVQRPWIDQLDVSDVRGVIVSYLEGTSALAPLRYLIRRLRRRLGGVPVVAGIWGEDGTSAETDRVAEAIQADRIAITLQAAIDASLAGSEAQAIAPAA